MNEMNGGAPAEGLSGEERSYYNLEPYEDVTALSLARGWSYPRTAALKYLVRAGRKEGVDRLEDLEKAIDNLKRLRQHWKEGGV